MKNEWIPCSERMPKPLEDVLMCDSSYDMAIGYYRQRKYADGREYCEWSSYDEIWQYGHDSVVAWMPLPEPYVEEPE